MPLYWLWYYLLPGLSVGQKLKLLESFRDVEELYLTQDYNGIGNLNREEIKALGEKDLKTAQQVLRTCTRQHIGILTFSDAGYPRRLRNIDDPPFVLFYKGILPDFESYPMIGVVGTRKASAYGLTQARRLSQQITACGGVVVSGGAAGVDTMALQGALEADGCPVAVLGCGVDVVYPKSNKKLFAQIEAKGCILSEFLPGTEPRPWQFPQRNRIISGISNGVLVAEAPERSGALITANDAMRQGRDVFAVPSNIDVSSGAGSNALLREGACAVFSGWDIIREYAAQYPDTVCQKEPVLHPMDAEPMADSKPAAGGLFQPHSDKKDIDNPVANAYSVFVDAKDQLTSEENRVVAFLTQGPCPVDVLVDRLDMPAAQVQRILTMLSLKGIVKNQPGGIVSL